MKIRVTAEDIEGSTISLNNCPVARAVKRATGRECVVGQSGLIQFGWEYGAERYFVPDIESFVSRFDHREPVEPFEFSLFVSGHDSFSDGGGI